MPCIILTGHPNSGKTSVAQRIRELALKNHGHAVSHTVLIIDDDLACPGMARSESYGTSLAEKKTRGALKAEFDRSVASNPTSLIILDSLNYIKGFRYELFCISKAANQKHCVAWVLNDSKTMSGGRYGKDLFTALTMRYEPPDERNRWDNPLYRIDLRQDGPPSHAAEQILNQSVYNMHNLSAALGTASRTDESTVGATGNTVTTTKPKSAASTFKKRSTFKRAVTTEHQNSASATPTTLTAEALSAFNNEADQKDVKRNDTQLKKTVPESLPPTEEVSRSLDSQIEAMLRSFLQDVEPLRQGTSTRQNVAADANVLNRFDAVTRAMVTGNSSLAAMQREYMSWISTRPPKDVSQDGIERSFQAFVDARKK